MLAHRTLMAEDAQRRTPIQYEATENGIIAVDLDAKMAKAEAARIERQLRADQAAYAADVKRRAEREDFLR